jgi:hypothetical protein
MFVTLTIYFKTYFCVTHHQAHQCMLVTPQTAPETLGKLWRHVWYQLFIKESYASRIIYYVKVVYICIP